MKAEHRTKGHRYDNLTASVSDLELLPVDDIARHQKFRDHFSRGQFCIAHCEFELRKLRTRIIDFQFFPVANVKVEFCNPAPPPC